MSNYQTRNTDCSDATRDRRGFDALARLMHGELRKDDERRRREAGTCACCGQQLPLAYRVYDDATGRLAKEVKPGTDAAARLDAKDYDAKKWTAYPMYHCDILLDAWMWLDEFGRKASPLDMAELMERKRIVEARMAFRDADKPKGRIGLERLEALG